MVRKPTIGTGIGDLVGAQQEVAPIQVWLTLTHTVNSDLGGETNGEFSQAAGSGPLEGLKKNLRSQSRREAVFFLPAR